MDQSWCFAPVWLLMQNQYPVPLVLQKFRLWTRLSGQDTGVASFWLVCIIWNMPIIIEAEAPNLRWSGNWSFPSAALFSPVKDSWPDSWKKEHTYLFRVALLKTKGSHYFGMLDTAKLSLHLFICLMCGNSCPINWTTLKCSRDSYGAHNTVAAANHPSCISQLNLFATLRNPMFKTPDALFNIPVLFSTPTGWSQKLMGISPSLTHESVNDNLTVECRHNSNKTDIID